MAEKINTITAAEFNAKGISSLADRPNQTSTYGTGGLTAQELKARFDALSITLKDKLNEIINVLASPQATKYIGLDGSFQGYSSLYDLLKTITSGELSETLYVETISGDKIPLNSIVEMLQMNDSEFEERITSLERGGGGSTGGGGVVSITVDDALSETSTNPVQNKVVTSAITSAINTANNKQDKLQAGTGIIINGNVISTTGGGGSAITVDTDLSTTSTNPVQNKVIANKLNPLSDTVSQIVNNYLGKTEAADKYLNKVDAEKQYVPYAEYRKAYIDVNDYLSDGVMDNTTFNAKLAELASQGKGGQDRVDVYFYNTGTKAVIFDNLIVWQSNCNYHYLLASDNSGTSVNLSLNNIKNCRFYGFYVYAVTEGYALNMQSCENIEFYDCYFDNPYKTAITIENCKSIYFNDCYIKGGNYPSQQVVCYIADSSTARRWIIFENCEIAQGTEASSVPLFACGDVSNANAVLFVLHCITNSNKDISASSFSKGSGKIRISALTSV